MQKLVLTFILTMTSVAIASEFRRGVSLEWDGIEGAAGYDVEFSPTPKGKPITISVKHAFWDGKLPVGNYTMRIRSKDRRKVPGNWSDSQPLQVGLENAKLIFPTTNYKLASNESEKEKVEFKWQKVPGADDYLIEVTSRDEKIKITEETSHNEIKIKIPVAQEYTWKVQARRGDIHSDATTMDEFFIQGKKLDKPIIIAPANRFVRTIEWQHPDFAENYDFSIQRWDGVAKKWDKVTSTKEFKDTSVPFDPTWPGGQYRISVRAKSNVRVDSDISQKIFPVVNGDRSPAAEEIGALRESIDRTNGWFFTASYLVTGVSYKGKDYDSGISPNAELHDLFGGTGRFGVGYLNSESPWGFLGIIDLSGFNIGDHTYNFGSIELNGIRRTRIGSNGELRQQFGLYYKELPVLVNLNWVNQSFEVSTIDAGGPHYGIEYWWALSQKLGFQLNAHGYYSVLTFKTPNGGKINPDLTYQLGLLGSYKLGPKTTGLMGYAYRVDSISYESKTTNNQNKASIYGHYLNLLMEWAL